MSPDAVYKKILIIDDDSKFAKPLRRYLEILGFSDIVICDSLHSGLAEIQTSTPDILLLDLILGDGSSVDLLRDSSVKQISRIVFITAHPAIETELGPLQDTEYCVLAKPLDPEHLKHILV